MRHPIHQQLRRSVETVLNDAAVPMPWLQDSKGALREIRGTLEQMRSAVEEGEELLGGLFAPVPVSKGDTVHEIWARHSGVRLVFARHHLPSCDACPVGADETLAEVAHGHGLDLNELLESLNDLLE